MLYSLKLQFRRKFKTKMVLAKAIAVVPIIVVTLVCLGVGAVVPWFIKGHNKSTTRTMIVLTAVCCWLFWLIAYMSQLNPLIGPSLESDEFGAVKHEW